MKGRLYANWLVIITVVLFFSSLGTFLLYIQNNLVSKQCAYGDDLGNNCICNSEGEKICDMQVSKENSVTDFTSNGLEYSFDFLNSLDINSDVNQMVKFSDISKVGTDLKVTLEIGSMCNTENLVSPQMGFFRLQEDKLILTVVSNLSNTSFNIPCKSENVFTIKNFNQNISETFKLQYQDEYKNVYQADTCIYEGYIRNNGDVYQSEGQELICRCENGSTVCSKD
ncbi:hypothetical protein GX618_00305 [Candidatus Dojkabacteria bacterium]|uniref:Uncharacterized protein n=1 Tax=Candidatus Dojkabacteria bacterium TaxID=2099670 RepID=A0A847ESP6_9BACT|nr:hypothetical protein [Candidatus Dojkabacteria bacterium]